MVVLCGVDELMLLLHNYFSKLKQHCQGRTKTRANERRMIEGRAGHDGSRQVLASTLTL